MSLEGNERQSQLTCEPIYEYKDIMPFLQNPPPWRSLCIELKPHSEYGLKNKLNNENVGKTMKGIENHTFCHFDPDTENIVRQEIKKLPKTLVCHDMANGYHDDSMIDGTGDYEAYTFYNWAGVDIFCYFSHHFITVPPLGWINAAHAHGVKVIGTLITEWTDGEALWDTILSSEEEWKNFACMLVAISKTMQFDGWLLNIENKVKKPTELMKFVRFFHEILHQELRDPELIWYDSVTVEGLLSWQNGLNQKNKCFFDACDGIFTNYSWSERDVETSAAAAGGRRTDVYVGVDVWGRNFYGGGQFNTQKAVEVAHKHGCSLAIFAFAWTHEAIPDNADSGAGSLDKYQQFLLRDRAFWGSIWPYLNTKLPSQLPFKTSFCRGQGKKLRRYGEILKPVPWYNLRYMQYQPNSNHGSHGYLLSTIDTILNVSHNLKLEGTFGYRDAFQALDTDDEPEVGETKTKTMSEKVKAMFRIASGKKDTKYPSDQVMLMRSHGVVLQLTEDLKLDQTAADTHLALVHVPGEKECLEVYFEDSFSGGSCLKVNPNNSIEEDDYKAIRLFHCDFFIKDSLVSCVVTKNLPGHEEQVLNIHVSIMSSDGSSMKVVLNGGSTPREDEDGVNVYPVNLTESTAFRELQKHLLANEPGFYVPTENVSGWRVKYYVVHLPGSTVMSINCQTEHPLRPILLGHFGLTHKSNYIG